MKNCNSYEERLAGYAAGSPDEAVDPDLTAHLETCPACRELAAQYRQLAGDLLSLEVPDPGDLFFQAQFRNIQKAVQAEAAPEPVRRRWWVPSLALAAAVVLLFIGFSKWQREPQIRSLDSTALQLLIEPDSGVGALGLEELNSEQLDRLATHMEKRILQEEIDFELQDESDWNELSGPELDQLLQRLQAQDSRRNHEA